MPTKKKISAVDSENVVMAPLSVSNEHQQSYNNLELLAITILLYTTFTLNLACELLTIISSRSVIPFRSKQPKFDYSCSS